MLANPGSQEDATPVSSQSEASGSGHARDCATETLHRNPSGKSALPLEEQLSSTYLSEDRSATLAPASCENSRQVLYLVQHRLKHPISSRATLIVCPLSVLTQWKLEIYNNTPENHLKVYVYHGANRNRDPERIAATYDVVLTTYATLASDFAVTPDGKHLREVSSKPSSAASRKRTAHSHEPTLFEISWFRVILDEAHVIKDRSTRTAKAAFAIAAERRWCVTGFEAAKIL